MKRIVFIIFQSTNKANGGVESISEIIANLEQFEPTIITQYRSAKNEYWKKKGIDVEIWKQSSLYLISLLKFNFKIFLRCLFDKSISVVHCNDINAAMHAAIGVWLAGKKLIFNVRDIKLEKSDYGVKWKLIGKLSNKIIVLSHDMGKRFAELTNISSSKIVPIYSIVDFTRYKPKNENETRIIPKKQNEYIIGIVAAVFSKKQQVKFLQQSHHLISSSSELKFYFIGDFDPKTNNYAKKCEEMVEQYNLQNHVQFVGYQSNMVDWYQSLDVNLVISEREGLARGMIEALSCGTPVISFDVPSADEILTDHACGIVVKQGDYEQLFKELITLLENKKMLEKYKNNSVKVTRSLFAKNKIVEQYEKIYLHC